jgi:hypothetical protein
MNFAMSFIIGRQLAINQGAPASQATTDGLVTALMKQPIGMFLALFLARNQAPAAAPVPAGGTIGTAVSVVPTVSTAVAVPSHVKEGLPVVGSVSFTNAGTVAASITSFGLTLPANMDFESLTILEGLPPHATWSYDASGQITFQKMPTTMKPGSTITLGFEFLPPGDVKSCKVSATCVTAAGSTSDSKTTRIDK